MDLIFATSNKNKVQEIQALLPEGFSLKSLADIGFLEEIPETGLTLEENAKLKACFLAEKLRKPCFSEDTGLEVEALNGLPGVRSARFAREKATAIENIEKLLNLLQNEPNKKAQFRTVITYFDGAEYHFFEGICAGEIITTPSGEKGFGYDPVFVPSGSQQSFASMSLEEKNKFSHRKKAFSKFLDFLRKSSFLLC